MYVYVYLYVGTSDFWPTFYTVSLVQSTQECSWYDPSTLVMEQIPSSLDQRWAWMPCSLLAFTSIFSVSSIRALFPIFFLQRNSWWTFMERRIWPSALPAPSWFQYRRRRCQVDCLTVSVAERLTVCQIPRYSIWKSTAKNWILYTGSAGFYRAMLSIRGTSHGPVSVCLCLSVCLCPSDTSRCSTKTAKRRITQTTPHDIPGTIVFWCQRSPRNSTGVSLYEGAECRWGGSKSATFDK